MEKCPLTGKVCKKHKIYHVTEIENGVVSKAFSLCSDCFEAYVANKPVSEDKLQQPPPAPMLEKIKPAIKDKFVEDMVAFVEEVVKGSETVFKNHPETILPPSYLKQCPNCNHTTANIIQTGKLGCPQCYVTFKEELQNVLYVAHAVPGSPEQLSHVGKKPKNWQQPPKSSENKKLQKIKLQYKMNIAVKEEDYEMAAKLRDQIKELEKDS